MRLGEDVSHVNTVKMTDVRSHDGMQLDVERIRLCAERPPVDRIVGLTAKVKVRHEQIADVRRARDLAAREIIHGLYAAQQLAKRVKLVDVRGERSCAIA